MIRVALEHLQDVPRESTASMPDLLFFNRRVARQIAEAADRIERTWEPKGSARPAVLALPPAREQRREIVTKGRRVRVVERRSATQLAPPL